MQGNSGMALTSEEVARLYGQLDFQEIVLLKKCVAEIFEEATIINIGAGFGTSAMAMLEQSPKSHVFSIDRDPNNHELDNLVQSSVDWRRVIRILGRSQDVGAVWPSMVDMVFVDGDHSTEAVRQDIKAWLPYIVRNGFMLFHDYKHPNVPELTIVVDEMMKEHEKIGEARFLVAYRITNV